VSSVPLTVYVTWPPLTGSETLNPDTSLANELEGAGFDGIGTGIYSSFGKL